MSIKHWFNGHFPYYRICIQRWCLRDQTYQHRCHLHQETKP